MSPYCSIPVRKTRPFHSGCNLIVCKMRLPASMWGNPPTSRHTNLISTQLYGVNSWGTLNLRSLLHDIFLHICAKQRDTILGVKGTFCLYRTNMVLSLASAIDHFGQSRTLVYVVAIFVLPPVFLLVLYFYNVPNSLKVRFFDVRHSNAANDPTGLKKAPPATWT